MDAIPLCYLLNELHLYSLTQHLFILIAPYMNTTCFGYFSGHHQACKYKNNLKELYFCINMPDDGLTKGRNMQHTRKVQLNLWCVRRSKCSLRTQNFIP